MNRNPHLPAMLVTRDIDNPDNVDKRVINYNNQATASWLYRHMQWALHNNKTVLLLPYREESDYEKVEDHDIPDFDDQDPDGYEEEHDEFR